MKMNSFSLKLPDLAASLHNAMIWVRHDAVSAAESLSRVNSAAGLLRQFETIFPVSLCLKHQLVPSVMMTLVLSAKCSAAFCRAVFAFSMNSAMSPLAKDV